MPRKFNKVLLINPKYSSSDFTTPVIPVGIGYIAESLKNNGISYSVMDMGLGYNIADIKKRVAAFRPDLIGISMMSFMYKNHYLMAKTIKNDFPLTAIVAGGPHVSSCRENVLRECHAIDFGILQEGEHSLAALCKGDEYRKIPGLLYRRNDKILCSEEPVDEDNLDALPFPKYDNFELNKYSFGISIVSSRGCPYQCIYCSAHAIRNKFRARSAKNVVEEIEYWYKRGYREFDFQEDNPTFNKTRLLEMCDEIEKRGLKEIMIMCGNGIRADRINKELLKRMKSVGFKRLAFGVEGGNDRVLKNIKKGETIEVVKKAIKEACELDFFVSLFFVVGSPGETMKDVDDSINIALSYPISHVNFFNLIPLPNTELYRLAEEKNYFIAAPEDYLNQGSAVQMSCRPVFETPEFPKKERIRALKKTKRIEQLVKKRSIEKNFKKLYPLNKLIAWLYTIRWVQKIENSFMRYALYRKTVGIIKGKIRSSFYK